MNEPDEHGLSYHYVGTRRTISYSEQIDDFVIADYDALGAVVGLEFLDVAVRDQLDHFLHLAEQASQGPQEVLVPASELARVA